MRKSTSIPVACLAALVATFWALSSPAALRAQQPADSSSAATSDTSSRASGLDLTIDHWGIGIGNVRHVNGVRLNYRDRGPFVANGINATIWMPHDPALGVVNGVALGLPAELRTLPARPVYARAPDARVREAA